MTSALESGRQKVSLASDLSTLSRPIAVRESDHHFFAAPVNLNPN